MSVFVFFNPWTDWKGHLNRNYTQVTRRFSAPPVGAAGSLQVTRRIFVSVLWERKKE